MSGSGAGAVAGAVGASSNLILGSVYTRFYFIHVAATVPLSVPTYCTPKWATRTTLL